MFKDLINFVSFIINPQPAFASMVDDKPYNDKEGKFLNVCSVSGGICLNPVCLIGCIED